MSEIFARRHTHRHTHRRTHAHTLTRLCFSLLISEDAGPLYPPIIPLQKLALHHFFFICDNDREVESILQQEAPCLTRHLASPAPAGSANTKPNMRIGVMAASSHALQVIFQYCHWKKRQGQQGQQLPQRRTL